MLTLILPTEQRDVMTTSLRKAGRREIGGILMGEHIGPNIFVIRKTTVHRKGAFSYFVRRIEHAISSINAFFRDTEHNYARFNYIGEWHSHPSFPPYPSNTDDDSMLQIVQDETVGANFVVLLIAKLGPNQELICTAHIYFPDGSRHRSAITFD